MVTTNSAAQLDLAVMGELELIPRQDGQRAPGASAWQQDRSWRDAWI
jgi:hypothetical protein